MLNVGRGHRTVTGPGWGRGTLAVVSLSLGLLVVAASPMAGARQAPAGQAAAANLQAEFERWWVSLPRVQVPVSSEGAVVVIVKFSDYQCPHCANAYLAERPILAKYEAQYPGKVKLIAKDYPLQPDCNANVPRPIHLAACDAAVAVKLARQHGKGDALEEHYYTHQDMLSPVYVRDTAASIGLVKDFEGQYQRGLAAVKGDIGLGRLLDVHSTPTYFINGVHPPGVIQPQALDLAIAYELKKGGVAK